MSTHFSAEDFKEMEKLASLVQLMNKLGHNPATSGNYSLRSKSLANTAFISESGIDKSTFTADHFIPLYIDSKTMYPEFAKSNRKSSDETDLHLSIYQVTNANCVLHSHMLESLLFANLFKGQDFATIEGLELLKGFSGIKTHETQVKIPCVDNTQDISSLSEQIKPILLNETNNYGLILRGHGIYVWGKSVEEAKRHLEVFEYIFKYYLNLSRGY